VATSSAIESEGLTKDYGEGRGVFDLALDVRAGEVYGYLGPNGAGKTTTIRLLLDLIRPSSGSARLFGLDVRRDGAAIKHRLGYLPGDLALYERLTSLELLRYLANLRGGSGRNEIESLAERFDLDLARPIGELSTGNRQKVGLVQAFMHRPEVLILDEPTAGLDPLMRNEFHRLAREVADEGRSVFLSSHVLAEVEREADRVGIVRDGRLVAVESVGELKERALRRLEIHFSRPVPTDAFERLAGIREARFDGSVGHFEVEGAVDELIKAAARFEVVSIRSHEPSLEEIFLAYYDDEARDGAR
jgi:ABC-2 type transport system ATP-binding protein